MRTRPVLFAVALAAFAAWWLCLGFDYRRTVDPVTGSETGPFSTGQVLALGAALLLVSVAGGLVAPWRAVAVAVTAPIVAVFAVLAGGEDGSGLWLVGAVTLAVGTGAGTAVCGLAANRLAVRWPRG